MKRTFLSIFLLFSLIFQLVLITSVKAQDFGLTPVRTNAGYTSSQGDIYKVLNQGLNIALSLLGIIFFGIMMYAGMRWMLARGNDELSQKAKTALTAGSIGLIIVIASYAISNFVLGRLLK